MADVNRRNINQLQRKLLIWFEVNGRKFPWRADGLSTYQLIITEALLQRTRAETISKFYEVFFKKHTNWNSLARADLRSLQTLLKPIGLYKQRAKRLKQLALEMVARAEVLPTATSDLEKIPFFGHISLTPLNYWCLTFQARY